MNTATKAVVRAMIAGLVEDIDEIDDIDVEINITVDSIFTFLEALDSAPSLV